MKFVLVLILVFTIGLNFVSAQDSTQTKSDFGLLILNITGFDNNEGTVKIALSDSEKDYTTKGKAYRTASEKIEKNRVQYFFDILPFGKYAIKIYHDENNNGELDTNFLGIPSEDYGFSYNAKGSFGPASGEDAQFTFDKDSLIIEINIDK